MATTHQREFPIQPNIGAGLRIFFYSQLFVTPAVPKASFAGKTVIVTGSNSGLGLEASRHFYRLGAAKLVLAVRTISKGQLAKENILASVKTRTDHAAIEIWPLDQASTPSTLAFANRVKAELPRVDAVVLNAGVSNPKFELAEGYDAATQVNVLNTFLLALSLLPKLNDTSAKFAGSTPHLTVVSSEAHHLTKFEEINAQDLYERLNDETSYVQQSRYEVTKLLEVLLTREIVARLEITKSTSPPVIINMVNPGLCASNLGGGEKRSPLMVRIMRRVLDRTLEVGARCYVLAAAAPVASHGEFQSDGHNQEVEGWIYTEMGQNVQKKVWDQTVKILEGRRQGLLKEAGL